MHLWFKDIKGLEIGDEYEGSKEVVKLLNITANNEMNKKQDEWIN